VGEGTGDMLRLHGHDQGHDRREEMRGRDDTSGQMKLVGGQVLYVCPTASRRLGRSHNICSTELYINLKTMNDKIVRLLMLSRSNE
jgi:hypothetical protein